MAVNSIAPASKPSPTSSSSSIKTSGVLRHAGTLPAAYNVNIAKWRFGRNQPGGEDLSFINLDSEPPTAVLDKFAEISAVTRVKLVSL